MFISLLPIIYGPERTFPEIHQDSVILLQQGDSPTLFNNSPDTFYRFYLAMRCPYKEIHIYRRSLRVLLEMCECYARQHLLFRVKTHDEAIKPVIWRWFHIFYEQLTAWSGLLYVQALVRWRDIELAVENLYSTCPSIIRDASTHDNHKSVFQPSSQETIPALEFVLGSQGSVKTLFSLRDDETSTIMELLDEVLDHLPTHSPFHKTAFHTLRKLCIKSRSLPASCIVSSGKLEKKGKHAVAAGGFSDVWLGHYDGQDVALKVFRTYESSSVRTIYEGFCNEAIQWRRLHHPNVTPFIGIDTTLFPLCILSPWMPNGNVTAYLKTNPTADRFDLLIDIAHGLGYLHRMGMVHGDLKGANILIDSDGHARLSDFGLTSVIYDGDTVNTVTTTSIAHGSTRWMAPELLNPESIGESRSRPSRRSDIYSFAMVMYEVLAGRLPFEECRRDPAVIYQVVVLQNRPKRPPVNDLSDDIWALMEACWNMDPGQRPNMLTTLTRLSSACGRPSRPEPGIGNINSAEFNVADSNLPASDVETGSVPVIEIVPPTPHIRVVSPPIMAQAWDSSSNTIGPRPATIRELAERARVDWDSSKTLKFWLKAAQLARNKGKDLVNGEDIEGAFVEYAKAATIALEMIPTHSEYNVSLNISQRSNLDQHGQQLLDRLSGLKAILVNRYEIWRGSLIVDSASNSLTLDEAIASFDGSADVQTVIVTDRKDLIHYPISKHQRKGEYVPGTPKPMVVPDTHPRSMLPPSNIRNHSSGLTPVILPRECLPRFISIAKVNTALNKETCGLLLGRRRDSKYVVTALLVPKQRSTSSTCMVEDSDLVKKLTEERGFLTIGSIHTHPSQSCFLTSEDLHTLATLQRVLPEAFMAVCAPSSTPDHGIFRLTDPPGLQTVLNCVSKETFHTHPELPIYTDCDGAHVKLRDLPLEILDLRDPSYA